MLNKTIFQYRTCIRHDSSELLRDLNYLSCLLTAQISPLHRKFIYPNQMLPRGRGYKTDVVTKQSFEQFTERVSRAFNNISIEEVDKLNSY